MQRNSFYAVAKISLLVAVPFFACSDHASSPREAVGTLSLPIVSAGAGDRAFVLCQGSLGIQKLDGAGTWAINAAEHAAEPSVTQALPSGSYRLSLVNWQLCEATGSGILPVAAQLISGSQIDFQIYPLSTTYVSYSFMVQDLTVNFGGDVVVQINVYEGNLGVAGHGNVGGTAGVAGVPSFDAVYDACIASCMRERWTAYYPAGGGSSLSCAANTSASCTTYCAYEVGRRDGRCRGGSIGSCCPEVLYGFYVCSSSGNWSCFQDYPGHYVSQPPLGCYKPSSCYGR